MFESLDFFGVGGTLSKPNSFFLSSEIYKKESLSCSEEIMAMTKYNISLVNYNP